ncbi:NUDIX domain-containing protein [Saccharothrix violaceirubra]|uniref:8-oxo-dGTP diphosphatase n=1 Tax=Saccharothrix violaceirubra TaxID=413306 RepID=A0A7W7T9F5_9PSEU|nr:NUDIX hydrolase [Saccharothrix violaceirubra]MBB4969022.1 8-oxo-dGTP diphosphatase [Saccharothrix violaceirubra]
MTTYTADLVVLAPRGGVPNLLLIERGKNPFANRWALPGGKVDSGETFTQAALRELVEETGVRVGYSALRRVGMYDEYGRDPRGRYVSTAFLVVLGEMPTAVAGDDAADVRWVPVTELDPVELDRLAFDHGRIVSDALAAWQVERAYLPHLGALITAVA